jgi:cell division protein FtsB
MSGGGRFLFFKALLFTLIAVTGWILINVRTLQEFLEAYEARNRERDQVEMLEQKVRTLEKQRKSLEYNGVEAEKQLREYHGMIRKGEKVIYLRTEQEETSGGEAAPASRLRSGDAEPGRDSTSEPVMAEPVRRQAGDGETVVPRTDNATRGSVKKSSARK